MAKVRIENVEGKQIAILTEEFNMGEVYEEQVHENGSRTVVAGVGIDGTERYFRQLLKDSVKKSELEQFDSRLDEWFKLKLNKVLGVTQYPLQFKDGGISGLGEEVEIEK
jgi:hypothetical protein